MTVLRGPRIALAIIVAALSVACEESPRRLDEGTPTTRNLMNLRWCADAVLSYRQVYKRWPSTLKQAMFERHWVSGDVGDSMLHASIPVIPGSDPPSCYHFVRPDDSTPPKAIMLYPNIRGDQNLLVVVRVDGTLDGLSASEYERELRGAGANYDALPAPLGSTWVPIGVIAAALAVALAVAVTILRMRRRGRTGPGASST